MLNRATPELLKGVFDAALRKYLNRFLNIPPAKLPKPKSSGENNNNTNDNSVVSSSSTFDNDPKTSLKELSAVLDKQQQINQAGQLVADYIYNGGNQTYFWLPWEIYRYVKIETFILFGCLRQHLDNTLLNLVKTMQIMNMSTFW
jgi:hypothetical protein